MHETDVLIIGAGQAGLAMGYHLKQKNVPFSIVGRENRIGDIWRKRYDSLVLFTPKVYSSLPGLKLEGDPGGYAGKDEIADYLERYAQQFGLPVELDAEIISLDQRGGMFRAVTPRGEFKANKVVVATGPFQQPSIPAFSRTLSGDVYQVHTSRYLRPSQLQHGPALIVGAGNSGAQIAAELSADRPVFLSAGHPMKFFPLQRLGKSIFWWFDKLGLLSAGIDGRIGRYLSGQGDPIFGYELRVRIRERAVVLKPRAAAARDTTVTFEDGSAISVNNVIWATGFKSDYSWLQLEGALDDKGTPIHRRGVSPVEGLYFLGRPWQHTRASALIGGVGNDAQYIADLISP